jgi:hypothetical protein
MEQPTPIEWLQQVYKVTGALKESDFNYANNWTKKNTYTEEQVIGFSKWATHIGFTYNNGDNCWYTEDVYKRTDEEMIYHYKECLKQNKTSEQ